MASGFSLKDQLFNRDKVQYLAGLFASASDRFDAEVFTAHVMERLPELELKQRISWISDCLAAQLPGDLPSAAPILVRALPAPLDPAKSDDDFGDFIFAPLGECIVSLTGDTDADLALDLLEEVTQRFSMEWALRPMLNRWPDETMARVAIWAGHDNYHVRRLASEGTRPRLPWGQAVGLDLADPLPVLDSLHADRTRYVTRSVANHLNDITKKDPDLVLDRLEAWRAAEQQGKAELDWMTAHALRGLIKAGHSRAMRLLGYDPDAEVSVRLDLSKDAVVIGAALDMSCRIEASDRQPVLVDYRLHFLRPSGKTSVKVFKWKQSEVRGKPLILTKRHKLKGDATTFTLVPGLHRVEVLVNGIVRAESTFDLLPD